MLPRRHIRIKAFQAIYAFENQPKDDQLNIQKEFEKNLNGYLNLYYLMIDLLISLHNIALEEIRIKKRKLVPLKEDANPSQRFVGNFIFNKLRKQCQGSKDMKNEKTQFMTYHIFKKIKKDHRYLKYMAQPSTTKQDDKNIIFHIIKHYFISNEMIHDFLEAESIYWNDDIIIVYNNICEKINNNLNLNKNKIFRKKDDKTFANTLIKETINKEKKIINIINKLSKNWDKDRIAISDLIIMRMAIIEMLYIENIPCKVTLDEYIEISKEYSTPKSKEFINGILDVFIREILKKNIHE